MAIIEYLRQYRFLKMAIFDLVVTFIFALIVHSLLWTYPLEMKDKEQRTWIQYLFSLFLIFVTFLGLGIISHRIFGIKSTLSAYLGFNDHIR